MDSKDLSRKIYGQTEKPRSGTMAPLHRLVHHNKLVIALLWGLGHGDEELYLFRR